MNYTLQSKEVKKMYQAINNPVNYGGLELKNRIIFAPTTFGLSDEEYFEKIRKIAAGGCAMIIVGDVPVGKRLCLLSEACPDRSSGKLPYLCSASSIRLQYARHAEIRPWRSVQKIHNAATTYTFK